MSEPAPPDDAWLDAECRRLLDFGRRVVHPRGGAAWLDDDGAPDLARPVHTWITSRTVHVYGIGALLGVDGAASIATGALDGLRGLLAEATEVFDQRFWDDDLGRVVDEWDRGWTSPAPYRGLNSTMHSLEAMLAVGDVTGDDVWHRRGAPPARPRLRGRT